MGFRISLVLLILLPAAAPAGENTLAGNWKLTILEDGQTANFWIVQLHQKDGKWSGEAMSLTDVPATTLKELQVSDDLLQFNLELAGGRALFQFQGKMPRPGAKKILGSLTRQGRTIPAYMESTTAKNGYELNRELIARSPNDPRVFAAALGLIEGAKEQKAAVKDVQEWTETVVRTAESYGPRFQLDYMMKLVEALGEHKEYAALAGDVVGKAEKLLDDKASPLVQLRNLETLSGALRKASMKERVASINERMEKLEVAAYSEYLKDALTYKPAKQDQAKGAGTVLVELFTGSMCPPCVAADLAFDGLVKTYPTDDVVLLQYHLHVPGPDPMTNADAEKRAEYYGRTLRGTPSVYFNGKPDAPGGGGRDDAADKYKEYRGVIDKLLGKPAPLQLKAEAARSGDKINVSAKVSGVAKPAETMRLRFALVEDWVRYKAPNGTQYHHRVVRALPGGPAGIAITKKDLEHSLTVDVSEIRAGLDKYLTEFEQKETKFPDAQRPLRLRNLHVVAFVQNDDNFEVLSAVDVPVKE